MADTPYDEIAKSYRDSKALPFRTHIEAHTLFRLLGDVRGLHVLDLACGEGIYSRQIMRLGAQRTLGVDLSRTMIALAEQEEASEPLGCDYIVGDASALQGLGTFDIVVGVYLLNYARSADQLLAFCRHIHASLRPGGRFIGFNDNLANEPEHYGSYRRYGFIKTTTATRAEGDAITYTLFNPDGSTFDIDNYWLSSDTYAQAFADAGFRTFAWRGPWLSVDGRRQFPPGHWDDFMRHPPLIGLEAVR